MIEGAVGGIEVRYAAANETTEQSQKLVVLSHPHPLHGGTMDNKVVTTMARAFHRLGYITVAYNFRGVGKSEGKYDHGVGEQDDLMAVVAWEKQTFNAEHLTLAGFSFGSYVSLRVAHSKKVEVNALCTVAPPVGLYDFSGLLSKEGGGEIFWTLIQGGQDEVVSAKEILNWAMSQPNKPDIYWREQAGHFFHGELIWLKKVILLAF
ncbi:Alpha/beta hydrolase [hydrothermal vent metagenome]|uniref:Alpha/beta hydrolase n=1 Tax=hydrothermal vent metagenome TaxID=652676 RepID=A0A3B0W0D4_9ZZZZ